jgi:hypothetical protein
MADGRISDVLQRLRARYWRFAPARERVLFERTEFPYTYVDEARLAALADPRMRGPIEARSRESLAEWVVAVDDALIEPSWGWAVEGLNRLVPRSLPYGKLEQGPHVGRFLVKRALYGTRPKRVEELVSLRDKYETYYWHVFGDLLPRLVVLADQGIAEGLPLLVAKPVFEAPYFEQVIRRAGLDRRTWIVQDGKLHVRAGRAYFCRPLRYWRPHFDAVLRLLQVPVDEAPPERRLFVTRHHEHRTVSNLAEIESIARTAGLEVIEPAELTLDQQIELFGAARKVVGVHGGGMTNIIFRGGRPLDVFELMASWWADPGYFWVSGLFGYRYQQLVGETVPGSTHFRVPPREFERALERFLAG